MGADVFCNVNYSLEKKYALKRYRIGTTDILVKFYSFLDLFDIKK